MADLACRGFDHRSERMKEPTTALLSYLNLR